VTASSLHPQLLKRCHRDPIMSGFHNREAANVPVRQWPLWAIGNILFIGS